jgi:hypothetical protein
MPIKNRREFGMFIGADVGKLALASFIAAAVFCSVYVAAVFLLRIATAGETEMLRSKLMHVGRVLKLA